MDSAISETAPLIKNPIILIDMPRKGSTFKEPVSTQKQATALIGLVAVTGIA